MCHEFYFCFLVRYLTFRIPRLTIKYFIGECLKLFLFVIAIRCFAFARSKTASENVEASIFGLNNALVYLRSCVEFVDEVTCEIIMSSRFEDLEDFLGCYLGRKK